MCNDPADPQRHAAGLHRLRFAVDVAERERRRVERGRACRATAPCTQRACRSAADRAARSRGLPRRTPRAASRCRHRDRADPAHSTSSVAACFASSTAGRSGAMRMPVASRTRVVIAAHRREHVSGSSHGASGGVGNLPHAYVSVFGPITTWSTTTMRSTPASSATRARSTNRCHSPSGKNAPKLGRPTVRVGGAVMERRSVERNGRVPADVARRRTDAQLELAGFDHPVVHSRHPRTRRRARRAAARPCVDSPGSSHTLANAFSSCGGRGTLDSRSAT